MNGKPDASGGNGDVYFDHENETATKYLRNTSTKERVERFKRELKVIEQLSTNEIPNIVKIIEVYIDDANIRESYIKMKKYDGSLSDLLDVTKGNPKFTLALLLPIIKALKILSESSPKIYHRDLKPDNILFLRKNDSYELYLTDFGTCFLKDTDDRITQENISVGARMFLAPEFEIGRVEEVDEKGDIYSIGKIIWYLINGNENALLPSNFWHVDIYDLSKKYSGNVDIISANLVIATCLNLNPSDRGNYGDLISMIENTLNNDSNNIEIERQHKVMQFQEKRKIERSEILTKNKLLVNGFSQIFLTALENLKKVYPNFEMLEKLYTAYRSKSKDGIDYTSMNVDNDAAHYLLSFNFDNIYISINYHPASKGLKYAYLSIDYLIYSTQKRKEIEIKYNEHGILVSKYAGNLNYLNEDTIYLYLDGLIINYIE